MHDADFAAAARPGMFTILKLPLRPLTIAHWLTLISRKNPIIAGKDCDFHHLQEAVLVCSQSWKELERGDPLLPLKSKILLWRNRQLWKSDAWLQELAEFQRYFLEGSFFPPCEREPDAGSGRAAGAPFLLRLVQFLVIRLHKTEAEAMDYHVALAHWHWASFWEAEQSLRVKNADDLAFDLIAEYLKDKPKNVENLKAAKKYAEMLCPT